MVILLQSCRNTRCPLELMKAQEPNKVLKNDKRWDAMNSQVWTDSSRIPPRRHNIDLLSTDLYALCVSFSLFDPEMQYKSSTSSSRLREEMAAAISPVAIGTQGTIGSLLMKEIEYFSKHEKARKPEGTVENVNSRRGLWFLVMSWRRKRRKVNNGGFLPSICSAVEVAEMKSVNGIPKFSYKILKNDSWWWRRSTVNFEAISTKA